MFSQVAPRTRARPQQIVQDDPEPTYGYRDTFSPMFSRDLTIIITIIP